MKIGIASGIAFLSLLFALNIASAQAPDPLRCNETDSGINYFTKGIVWWESQGHQVYSYTDICSNGEMLTELYCLNGDKKQVNYNCSGNYGECYDGACVKCSSESDSGNSIYVKGSVTLSNGSVLTVYCIDDIHLQEYACSNNEFQKYLSPCPVCRMGQCLFCTDSDDGRDYSIKGEVKVNFPAGQITSYNDRCDGDTLTEYYCKDGIVQSETVRCSPSCDIDSGICLNPCTSADCIGASNAQTAQPQTQPPEQTLPGTTLPAQHSEEAKPQSGEGNDSGRKNDDIAIAKDASQPAKKGAAPKSKWEALGIILIINNILGVVIALIISIMLLKSIHKK